MKINVKTHPKAKQEKVLKIDDTHLEIWVREAPDKGRANEAVVEVVAYFFKVPKSRVLLISGMTSRNKVVEVSPR